MVYTFDNVKARLIGIGKEGKKLHVYVLDAANAIFLSRQSSTLENPVSGTQPGLKLTQASGVAEINWTGEIWAIANAASVQAEVSID